VDKVVIGKPDIWIPRKDTLCTNEAENITHGIPRGDPISQIASP
ncbi:unnamed protein product, partial [Acidithrix sp. C25]